MIVFAFERMTLVGARLAGRRRIAIPSSKRLFHSAAGRKRKDGEITEPG
jgi:hypothetical protein